MNKIIIILAFIFIPLTCFAGSPDAFFGTYQGFSRACQTSFLVLSKETVSIDECKKSSYTIIESDEDHILIELKPSEKCDQQIIRLEREKPRYDLPLFGGFVVQIYENHQEVAENNAKVRCNYGLVDPSMAEDQTVIFLNGKTGQERGDALHKINLQGHSERDKYNEQGLRDTSPDVREMAASFLRGDPNHFVPVLIDVMAYDVAPDVRASAGYSLSHFYTDNGAEGYLYIKPLEKGLDKLLIGLKNTETLRSIVAILGSRYAGESVAPCYMSMKNRKKVVLALEKQFRTIQLASEAIRRNPTGKVPWNNWNNQWNEARGEITNAIANINQCDLIKR